MQGQMSNQSIIKTVTVDVNMLCSTLVYSPNYFGILIQSYFQFSTFRDLTRRNY